MEKDFEYSQMDTDAFHHMQMMLFRGCFLLIIQLEHKTRQIIGI